jgi:hypothetical protein
LRQIKKADNWFIESQRGALINTFHQPKSVDVNNNNQRQHSDPGQDDEHNIKVDGEVN